ncbi:MAG: hypothetical protein WBZ48_09460 [Bacteroidota bacterium]
MEFASRLRRHLGDSAYLIDLQPKARHLGYLVDFTRMGRGKEITLIEVGEHGITVEFVASGGKHIFTFDEIQVKEGAPGRTGTFTEGLHRPVKSV